MDTEHEVKQRYESLWREASKQFEVGKCAADAYLAGRLTDERRGITLVARLPSTLVDQVHPILDRLRSAFPEQYVTPESDLHVTVLSVEPVREDFSLEAARLPEIIDTIDGLTDLAAPCSIRFSGLSASPSVVFLCGYPSPPLNELRDQLRSALSARGLCPLLDSRYRVVGGHFSVLRFIQPVISASQMALLSELRNIDLGHAELARLELVGGNWYTQIGELRLFARWDLSRSQPPL